MVTVYTYLSLRSEDEDLLAIALLALGMTTVHDVIVGRALATTVFAHGALAAVVVGHAAVGPPPDRRYCLSAVRSFCLVERVQNRESSSFQLAVM